MRIDYRKRQHRVVVTGEPDEIERFAYAYVAVANPHFPKEDLEKVIASVRAGEDYGNFVEPLIPIRMYYHLRELSFIPNGDGPLHYPLIDGLVKKTEELYEKNL